MSLLSLGRAAVCVGLAILVAGCGGGGKKPVYAARGYVVTAAGDPAVGAMVVFHPLGKTDETAHKPAATVGTDGAFVLTTYTADDGAPPGEYAVTVEWRPPSKRLTEDSPDKLGGRFRDPKTTPFKRTVEAKPNELEPIKLP